MGNADFRGVMTGPVGEVQVGHVFILARGGYQNNTTFHSGAYGGFEVYFPFSQAVEKLVFSPGLWGR
jgi:hypothetical protein